MLSPDKIARIYFQSAKGVELSSLSVDGHALDNINQGIDVLPGDHQAAANFYFESTDCRKGQGCLVKDLSGMCHGVIRTRPGKSYVFQILVQEKGVNVTVLDYDAQTPSGEGSCALEAEGVTFRAPSRGVKTQ